MISMSTLFKSYVGVELGEPLYEIFTFNINNFHGLLRLFADDTVLFVDTLKELQMIVIMMQMEY